MCHFDTIDKELSFLYIKGMGFEFGGINTSVKQKNQEAEVKDTSLLSIRKGRNKHLLFLLENPIRSLGLKTALNNWITKQFTDFDIDIVSASAIQATSEQIKKQGIYRFYLENSSDYSKLIRPDETIVVPFGTALSSIIRGPDLSTECFYDFVFNNTHFYSPQINANVFPIDSVMDLFKLTKDNNYSIKDCSRQYYALHQFQKIKDKYDQFKEVPVPERLQIEVLKTKEDWNAFIKEYSPQKRQVSWDIETTGLNYLKHRVLCMTMSFDGKKGFFIPWNIVDMNELDVFFANKKQIGQNLKFDVKFLKNKGMKNPYIHEDTLQLGQTLNEMRFNGLKSLAYHYTLYGGYDEELDRFKEKFRPPDYSYIPLPLLTKYATMDAIIGYQVWIAQQAQLAWVDITYPPEEGHWTVRDFYEKVKIPTCNSFVNIEMGGLYVDEPKWDENAAIVESKINDLKEKLTVALDIRKDDELFSSLAPDEEEESDDTLQSGMQLGKILQERGWECLGLTKAKYYLTGDAQLERWKQMGHAEAELIQSLRSYLTLQKTFMGKCNDYSMGWRRFITHHSDGSARIHPSYKSMMTDTHRNGCGDPNYQQGPASAKDAKLFKQIYSVPDKDKYYLVTLDYSGFQMRLAAIDSEDPVLFNGYRENPKLDVHSKTGYNVFCKGQEFDVEEIVVNGNVYFPHEEVKVIRGGKQMKVKASELQKEDTLK
jgi:DNA polymerase I-like protein with 3'-5' exonuclease and polymerase domains